MDSLHSFGLAALVVTAAASLIGVVYMAVVRMATKEAHDLGHEEERADAYHQNAVDLANIPASDDDAIARLRASAAAQREREAADVGGAKAVRGAVFQKYPADHS